MNEPAESAKFNRRVSTLIMRGLSAAEAAEQTRREASPQ
jgi:hypothetical protein